MCVGFRCRARIIIPLFFLFPDGRGLNKGKSFLVAAFVVHADFIQVHAFVFVLLGESDFDFIAPYFIFSALPSPKILEIYPICLRIFGIGGAENLSAIDASAE